MIIKKLELQGFKSFPEKTKILFHPGITAVVGPNGTGKSNIVDALLWVLGGKRFRTLRGERSTDIIFNGHESKPPLSMADVNLHLDDGEEEVIINHRYFRSGESEYRLNGRLARLKDIQDFLWKKAIGELRYFVIEQGSIGLFLNAKPVEKRALLEEAAGTAYYKDKKVQAESKLQSSEQNLTRLEDILSEVSRAKNSLKRQANAAIRYRKLRDRIRTLTALHYRKRIEELEREQKEAALRYENILHQENTVLSRIKTQEKSLAAIRKEAWNLEKALKEGTANLYSLKSQFTRLDTEKDEKKRSLSLLEEKKQKAEERIQELTQEQASLEKERTMVLSSLKQQEESLAQKRQDLEQASRTMASFQERKARSRKNLESLRNRYFQSIHLTTEAKNEKARLERELEILLRQEEKLKSQMQREKVRLEESGERINKRQTEIHRIAKTQEKIQKDLESRKKERDDLLSSIHAFQEKIDKLKKTRDREIQHLELLQKIETEERRGGTIESIPGSSGILADLIESDPEYAPLIDILWRDEVKAQLLRPEDFLKSLGEKKREGLFFLLHPEKREKPLSQVDQDPRVLGRLKSHIRAQTKIKEFISSLKEAFLVKDIKSAVELWLKFPSQNYMTAEGHLLLSSGIVMMGGKKEGFFTLVQDIKTLKQSIFSLEKKISPLELEIKNKEERAKALDEDIKRKNESLASLEKEKEEKENEIALDRTGEEKVKLAVSTLQKELRILGGDKGEIQKRLQTVESRLRAIEKEETSLREALQTEEKHIETMEKENEEKRKAFFELKSEIGLLEEKTKNLRRQSQALEKRKESLQMKSLSNREEIQNAEERISGLNDDIQQISVRKKDIERQIKQKERNLAQSELLLKKTQKELEESEQRIEGLREAHEQKKEERVEWEVKKAEKDRDLANLEESCWQELKKSLEEVKKEVSPEMLKEEDTQNKLAEAQEKLQKFKAVNLMAEEEYANLKKRYDFLIQQKKDLRESIDTTKQAIKRIDQESKTQFLKALAEVNTNLQEVFSLLFDGGRAELRLSDEVHPMESGVEIIAQPPGKKLQSLSLLSGGEKSLTSLAFFFALFRYRPTPFCILDEVDAALDDVNLERFLNLMKKIKERTQFILITHNLKTMEVADYIYGTTMAEPNITTLYSVKLEKKRPAEIR